MVLFRGVVQYHDPSLGGTGVSIFHGRGDGSGEDDANYLMGTLHDFYESIKVIFPSTCTVTWDGSVVTFDTPSPALFTSGAGWTTTGTGSTHPSPPANCIVAGWQTSLHSRSGRGRTFLGPIDRDQVQDNGTPYEEIRSDIESAAGDLIDAFDGAGDGALGVWSPTDSVLRDFTGCKVANQFAVLRSRRN